MKSKGTVYLVGAGPGDAGLLTLRGKELLRRADVVIYDMLVNPELLKHAAPSAELISRGSRGTEKAMSQDDLNALMIARANEGKCVVRLKGGDPYIFGRGGEEVEELVAAKIPFEVVPGVSSVFAAPNYAGIPITHRDHCSTFTVLTGHEDPAKGDSNLDFEQIARVPGTKIILMGLKRLGELTETLIARGLPSETPVAIVRSGTTGRQQSIEGTLSNIAKIAAEKNISPPAITVIGEVVKLRSKLNWFERRPLFGRRIVVTRTRAQASELSRQLRDLGATVLEIPTIKLEMPGNERKQDIVDALLELNSYSWLVFTSPNGVTAFFDLFFKRFHDLRDIGGARIAAIGPATAAKLRELHLQVDVMPDAAVAVNMAAAINKFENVENLKICLLRAEVANPDLPRALEALGAIVDDIAVYKTVPETADVTGHAADLTEAGADWIMFTSSSTAEHFHARFDLPKLLKKFPQTKIASIGPETSKAIRALDLEPTFEANPHSLEGLVAGLLKAK
ncbi:MAG TPA: uroporphyrinogen-III C-methyltransferase [Verrucomicrobiae bacterium]|nr:uroporphyrinogen-III C-methyltransferase [Verrucomicrobiae bacterium]